VVHFTPTGRRIDQAVVRSYYAAAPGAVLLCGRYEGVRRQRVVDSQVTDELSLGGLRALWAVNCLRWRCWNAVVAPAGGGAARASHEQDSFSDGLLEGPITAGRKAGHRRRRTRGAGGAAVGSPRRDRTLAREQALALTGAAPPRPDHRRSRRWPPEPADESYLASLKL